MFWFGIPSPCILAYTHCIRVLGTRVVFDLSLRLSDLNLIYRVNCVENAKCYVLIIVCKYDGYQDPNCRGNRVGIAKC